MTKQFRKADIEFHSDRRESVPAINVKVYRMGADAGDIAARFGCSEATAEQALQYAFESAQQRFWEDAQDAAREIFGERVKVYSMGRCGGWLYLDCFTADDVAGWDAVAVSKWARLVKWCAAEIAHLTSAECLLEDIEANEWHKDGSELYNHVQRKDGTTACIADLKQGAKAAGFGPVVRP